MTLDRRLVDPEGFLGPSWLRLPMLVLGAFLLDMLPRTLWVSRLNPKLMPDIVRDRVRDHWTRERMTLVVMGLVCFYITYVSYRNLKSFLPVHHGRRRSMTASCTSWTGRSSSATSRPRCCTTGLRHRLDGARAVLDLPLVPAAGPARAGRLARVVAQHHLRLLVRHLPVPGLDARDCFLLRPPDTRVPASPTPGSTRTCPTPGPGR